jgi:hypothetical protein
LVSAEPGDPYDGDNYEEAYENDHAGRLVLQHSYRDTMHTVTIGHDLYHQNLRYILNSCLPDMAFESQLQKFWLTDSVLCSAPREGGNVSKSVVSACGRRYLLRQFALFPKALIVAVGGKAKERLLSLNLCEEIDFIHVRSISPPGCNYKGSRESWERIPMELRRRQSAFK